MPRPGDLASVHAYGQIVDIRELELIADLLGVEQAEDAAVSP
jgi:hypothetical protein